MEGIILSLEALASPWSLIGGVSLLAIVVRAVGFGYMRRGESRRRLFWVDWPIPGTEETSFKKEGCSGSRLDNIHGTGRGSGQYPPAGKHFTPVSHSCSLMVPLWVPVFVGRLCLNSSSRQSAHLGGMVSQ